MAPGLTQTHTESLGNALSPQAGRPGPASGGFSSGVVCGSCSVKSDAGSSRPPDAAPPPPRPAARRHPPRPVLRRGHRGTRVEQRPLVHCGTPGIDSKAINGALSLVCFSSAPALPSVDPSLPRPPARPPAGASVTVTCLRC